MWIGWEYNIGTLIQSVFHPADVVIIAELLKFVLRCREKIHVHVFIIQSNCATYNTFKLMYVYYIFVQNVCLSLGSHPLTIMKTISVF